MSFFFTKYTINFTYLQLFIIEKMFKNMKLSEFKRNIHQIVQECILEMQIENVVRQTINETINKKPKKYITEKKNSEGGGKRKQVMKMLGDEKFEHAYLAYKLWHPKDQSEKDTYRSLFSKKYTGKPDADGTVRHFTTKEINKLYNLLTKNK